MREKEPNRSRFGTCPVCGKGDKYLYFAKGAHNGKLWCDWICVRCLKTLRKDKQGDDGIAFD